MPRAAALGKDLICRGPVFAEGRTLGKGLFAEGRSLPRAPVSGPRQRVSLPSARYLALGKARVSSSELAVGPTGDQSNKVAAAMEQSRIMCRDSFS